jgi:hypothetical protein
MTSIDSGFKQRDLDWLKHLSFGPSPINDAFEFYRDLETGRRPLHFQQVYAKVGTMAKRKIIRKVSYSFMPSRIFCFLTPLGASILLSHGYDPLYLKIQIPPDHLFQHEYWLTQVIRRIFREEKETKTYKILSILDDGQMKMKNLFHAKGTHYADLELKIQTESDRKDILIEMDGLNLIRSRYIKKLSSLPEDRTLLVITSQEKRIGSLWTYTAQALKKPKRIFFSPIEEVLERGLTDSRWISFATKQIVQLSFEARPK